MQQCPNCEMVYDPSEGDCPFCGWGSKKKNPEEETRREDQDVKTKRSKKRN